MCKEYKDACPFSYQLHQNGMSKLTMIARVFVKHDYANFSLSLPFIHALKIVLLERSIEMSRMLRVPGLFFKVGCGVSPRVDPGGGGYGPQTAMFPIAINSVKKHFI